ncbi:alcohol dehydrogenase [Sphingobium jiangsuense]|uniref:Threonine dehydrogenase-like Zn-dependent dehydrogenase n=1 Tax=Sphingobium jiangsuense TaxID=870476 RepID=A0A7W6FR59_9SPHN|nr:alcohol dehydrogenase catalytic domain-containing protein [Sphingobium jiangsuense]MBB3927387.1 threonine dehydrogenase-like Zn-dependent dehydrogenase [Sphingobium jiangsuense]GLT00789.1 alcohol dehydrogenase [Sphingobium jiangsuense]
MGDLPVRAAVKVDVEKTEIREFERPRIGADDGLLRVEASGVGGSDPEMYRKPDSAPCIMGHENVGMVEALGENAARRWGLKPGDRIALHEYLPCWHCHWCRQGDFRLCMEADFFNVKDQFNTLRYGTCNADHAPHLWGGNAHYMYLAPNAVIHRIPADMDARHATLAVPLGNGVQWAVLDGGAGLGKTVLVYGPGQQGLGCALAAKAAGAAKVILCGMTRDRARLDLAPRLGADIAVDVEQEDLEAIVMRETGGRGVDVVVDTTGDPTGAIAAQAVALAAKGAWLNLNGLRQQIPIGEIKKRYLTVRAPRGHSYRSVELALQLIGSGRWPVDLLCSHDFGLDQVHDAILATAGRGMEGAIHVTVSPWRDA